VTDVGTDVEDGGSVSNEELTAMCWEHGKPFAQDGDWDRYDEGEGTHLCWGDGCVPFSRLPMAAADALAAADAREKKLRRQIARRDDALTFIAHHEDGAHGVSVRRLAKKTLYKDPDIEWAEL
jgi:hypothetical protein